jgi:hypothetical protein
MTDELKPVQIKISMQAIVKMHNRLLLLLNAADFNANNTLGLAMTMVASGILQDNGFPDVEGAQAMAEMWGLRRQMRQDAVQQGLTSEDPPAMPIVAPQAAGELGDVGAQTPLGHPVFGPTEEAVDGEGVEKREES